MAFQQPYTRRLAMSIFLTIFACVLLTWIGNELTHAGSPNPESSEMNINTNPESAAFQTVDGTLLEIDGEFYVVEDFTGKQLRLHVGRDTVLLNGQKKPGDILRVEITKSGHAISIL